MNTERQELSAVIFFNKYLLNAYLVPGTEGRIQKQNSKCSATPHLLFLSNHCPFSACGPLHSSTTLTKLSYSRKFLGVEIQK